MPKIAYVCEECWDKASESSCWEDRNELRIAPSGRQICNNCYDFGDWKDDKSPAWSTLPLPPEYRAVEVVS